MSDNGESPDNRAVWDSGISASQFGGDASWSDPGERAAVAAAGEWIDRSDVLDVGIGAGRTTSILLPRVARYVGVDFAQAMVDAARKSHPTADIRLMDARALEPFRDGEFDFVQFSYNGIDSVPHGDRAQILEEFHRVLRPGGALLVSALNIDGSLYRSTPWLPRSSTGAAGAGRKLARKAKRVVRASVTVVRAYSNRERRHQFRVSVRNWRQLRRQRQAGDGWGIDVLDALDFGVLAHFENLRELRSELGRAGFEVKRVWTETGDEVSAFANGSTAAWFQVLALVPEDARPSG